MTKQLMVWGASGHARCVLDIVRQYPEYSVVGLIDDFAVANIEFVGHKILGTRDDLRHLHGTGFRHMAIAVGDCSARLEIGELARSAGFNLETFVHPRAVIAQDVSLGDGTVVMAGAVVNPGSRVGELCIVNTAASVDHECTLEDGVHVGPGAHLGGCVVVGRGTWLGIGAILKDHIRIGAKTIVGAGAVVLHDLPSQIVAYGVPARVVRAT